MASDLNEMLGSMGREFFIKYLTFLEDGAYTHKEVCKIVRENEPYSDGSINTRVSRGRKIARDKKLLRDALKDIVYSKVNKWAREEAYEKLLAMSAPAPSEDVYEEDEQFTEGALKSIKVNAFERNPRARAECIKRFGFQCYCCGVKLGDVYGEVADKIIHVHHIIPLSEIRSEHEFDPQKHLRPVCPNCHAVIHSRKPAYKIKEIKDHLENDNR